MKELIAVKVGTSTLVGQDGKLDDTSFLKISSQLKEQKEDGKDVVLISSGAISAGALELGTHRREASGDYDILSAFAAYGQVPLVNKWAGYLYPLKVAQNLITPRELKDEVEGSAYVRKLESTIALGGLALINENDAVADTEIKFGDNDRLAALVAARLQKLGKWQVRLVMLSDVDGFYNGDPADEDTRIFRKITDELDNYADCCGGGPGSVHGSGGMETKISAAKIANEAGVPMYLGEGRENNIINRLLENRSGTGFFTQNAVHLVE